MIKKIIYLIALSFILIGSQLCPMERIPQNKKKITTNDIILRLFDATNQLRPIKKEFMAKILHRQNARKVIAKLNRELMQLLQEVEAQEKGKHTEILVPEEIKKKIEIKKNQIRAIKKIITKADEAIEKLRKKYNCALNRVKKINKKLGYGDREK